ncbi:MAG: type I DNA topoisomerase [Caldilineales bacterium]
MEAYCTKCKTKREMADAQPVWLSNGSPATKGVCTVCGTRLNRMGATDAHASLSKPAVAAAPKPAGDKKASKPKATGPAPEDISAPLTTPVESYCVKCKTQRKMVDGRAVFMSNGRPGARGACEVCGTNLFKIGATPDHEGLPTPVVTKKPRKSSSKSKAKSGKAKSSAKSSSAGKSVRRSGKLVIVESPAKARTVGRFLGKGYTVRASVGHVRDLLKSTLSVDVENDFEPRYRVPNDARKRVKELKQEVDKASEIFLATDPDREGEAIAWHVMEATEAEEDRTRRVVFHEITSGAVAEAFAHPRGLNMDLVNAQQARRILDRLVGYKISPLLWDKVQTRTSAGRVQSVAVRLVVEREREIENFVPVEYWSIRARLAQQETRREANRPDFLAKLHRLRGEEVDLSNEADTQAIVDDLEGAHYLVSEVRVGERRRKPAAPFTTSTMQQEASRKIGFGARQTMRAAQQLYEGIKLSGDEQTGLITYMRTDSVNVSSQAQSEARQFIGERYGSEYLPPSPPVYKTRAKGAQEAHEAIRPTSVMRTPESVAKYLNRDQNKLYDLIWKRFVASQMSPAIYDTISVDIAALPTRTHPTLTAAQAAALAGALENPEYLFRASGSRVRFAGFLSVYVEGRDENGRDRRNGSDKNDSDDDGDYDDLDNWLPALTAGELLDLLELLANQHFTQPPPRYTEASLVKALEENGIGRPSTYAPTMTTIQSRNYVEQRERRLYPTELGFAVVDRLVEHFPDIFDVGYTAKMEEALDEIADEHRDWVEVLRDFYEPLEKQLAEAERTMKPAESLAQPIGETCPEDGGELVLKIGRFGKFIACSNYPECRYTRPFVVKTGVTCPKCKQGELVERRSKKGRTFYGCERYPECDFVVWQEPVVTPCPDCGGLLTKSGRDGAKCTVCGHRFGRRQLEAQTVPA